jgi:hypothetical protein
VTLVSNPCTSDANGSSGSSPTGVAGLTEKRVPAVRAASVAERKFDSHERVENWPGRMRLTLFADFFLFNVMTTECRGQPNFAADRNKLINLASVDGSKNRFFRRKEPDQLKQNVQSKA